MQTRKEQDDTTCLIGLDVINVLAGNDSKPEMHMKQRAFDLITDIHTERDSFTRAFQNSR
jgi:hypothetical protein